MRFVVLFAAACALGCVAEAAVAPELGYVKLLTGEKDLKFCDGTICSKGCCPEPGFDCCHDGTHCANNVANCPGCPNDGVNTGGWCKENQDDFGELTEDDPCCQAPDNLFCNYDTDHAGKCEKNHADFCKDVAGFTKCGSSHCCDDAAEVCCELENKCVAFNGVGEPDGTECNYCGGDVCGPEVSDATGNALDQMCCLPPNECCQDGTATCTPDGTTDCNATPGTLCGSNPNTQVDCGVVGGDTCCPNGLAGCYDSTDPANMYITCPGEPCGAGNYCVGPKPYCCDDGMTCAAHPDECTSDPGPTCGTDTCTVGETCCNDICDTGVNLVCCVTSTDVANSCPTGKDCCATGSKADCCPSGETCCASGSVGANDCEATASDCDVTPK